MTRKRLGVIGLPLGALALMSAILMMLSATGAQATAPANTGYDDRVQVIRGAGSDTTYLAMQRIEIIYNQGAGCTLSATNPALPPSPPPPQDWYDGCTSATGTIGANYDHDVAVGDYQIGSSAGIRMLCSASPGHSVQYARSSRDKQGSDCAGLSFNGFAKDGIAIITFGNRQVGNITKAQLLDIFTNGTADTWSEVTGNAGDTQQIKPYGVQSSSGTYLTFRNYLDGLDPNTGPNAIGAGRVFFENDASPIDLAADKNDAIWWMSFGPYAANPAKKGSAQAWQLEGHSISFSGILTNDWPITRYLWHVIKTSDETATSGTTGASRAFKEWLCKTSANHIINPQNDQSHFADITQGLAFTGFQRVPTAESDAGTRCVRQTT